MIFLTVIGELKRIAAGESAADSGFDVLSRKRDPVPNIEGRPRAFPVQDDFASVKNLPEFGCAISCT